MQPSSPFVRFLIDKSSLLTAVFGVVLAASCASSQDGFDDGGVGNPTPSGDDGGSTSTCGAFGCGGGDDAGSGGNFGPPTCGSAGNLCVDFQTQPIIDDGTPSGAASFFSGTPGTSGGPCIVEPQDGTLFPRNWLRPRILVTPASAAQNIFQITIETDVEANPLIVYTANASWKMPADTWVALATNAVGHDIKVTVAGASMSGGGAAAGSTSTFNIAPVTADGAMIYWTTADFNNNATNTTLQGFHVGDEGITPALATTQVQQLIPRADELFPDGGTSLPSPLSPVKTYCIGCHTATPDGNNVAFNVQWPWAMAIASVQADGGVPVGGQPTWLSAGAIQNLAPDYGTDPFTPYYAPPAIDQVMLGISTFSKGHYTAGDHVMVAQLGSGWNSTSLTDNGSATGVLSQLAWFDLEWNPPGGVPADGGITAGLPRAPCQANPPGQTGTTQPCITAITSNGGWGIIQRQGDTRAAGSPSWNHKGDVIAYSSTDVGTKDGRMDCAASALIGATCVSDVYTVQYNANAAKAGGAGGAAAGVPGASDPAYNEYYPAFSGDDQFIAFNRVAANHSMYNTPEAEVYVVPASGGTSATRLAANDPVACTNIKSPGAQNTWPKWSPDVPAAAADGKLYYWLTFSSTRSPIAAGKAQLYVAAVVVDTKNNNAISTYPAIYLWNQDKTVNNLIPSWENFTIPKGTIMVQ